MDRLAVFTLKRSPKRWVMILSEPHTALTGTVVAAPLFDARAFPAAPVLNPFIEIGGVRFALATEQMAAIRVKELGEHLTSCLQHEYAVANAINRLFFGI